jgi:hypothetical protein
MAASRMARRVCAPLPVREASPAEEDRRRAERRLEDMVTMITN